MIVLKKLTMEETARLPKPCEENEHELGTVAVYDDGLPFNQMCLICRTYFIYESK